MSDEQIYNTGGGELAMTLAKDRLEQQLSFIVEIDKLKSIYRQNYTIGERRRESDAEHSWHLAIMALLLAEHVDERIDLNKVVKMLLLHDLVEIDAGDTYCYDSKGLIDKAEREIQAATRLFALLPLDQAEEWRLLWEEFEAASTAEAKFAAALDRLQPLLLHYHTEGQSWREHNVTQTKVQQRNQNTALISKRLGILVQEIIEQAIDKGYLAR